MAAAPTPRRIPGSGHRPPATSPPEKDTRAMTIIRSGDFTADRAWGALGIAEMNGITTRLHWTDRPYHWHVNDGQEVFVVLGGRVEMRYRQEGTEHATILEVGDIFVARVGTEHVASPLGEARVLVVECRRKHLTASSPAALGPRTGPVDRRTRPDGGLARRRPPSSRASAGPAGRRPVDGVGAAGAHAVEQDADGSRAERSGWSGSSADMQIEAPSRAPGRRRRAPAGSRPTRRRRRARGTPRCGCWHGLGEQSGSASMSSRRVAERPRLVAT